ncbi:MAG: cytochrome c biogenesis protein CcsA [Pseudomonadales bacterium]|nr:cytochrome c biogenesis protein CcsA [Pseudomonadales bacterium]
MISATLSGSISAALYLVATTYVFQRLSGNKSISKHWFLLLGLIASLFHIHSALSLIFSDAGLDLGLFYIGSLIGWVVILTVLTTNLFRPFENIAIIAYPIAALSIVASLIFESTFDARNDIGLSIAIHILLSICAYSVLFIAVGQAVLIAIQNRQLKKKQTQSIINVLPPLQTMESVLFEIIWLGIGLLTASILTGFMFYEDIFQQHLAHKSVFSLVAWLTFAVLLSGRYIFGWRGRTAIRWTYSGFAFLMIGYFGSKFVLEFILIKS